MNSCFVSFMCLVSYCFSFSFYYCILYMYLYIICFGESISLSLKIAGVLRFTFYVRFVSRTLAVFYGGFL